MTSIEKQLKDTQKELTDLKEEYQEFVYATSHDLSAVFRVIEGFSQIIAMDHEGTLDKETKLHFEFITKSVKKGKEIQESLLELSRLTTRADPFSRVDSNELVNEATESLTELIQSKKAHIEFSDLPLVIADRQQMTLLFFHLIQNALIYQAENSQPHIVISAKEKDHCWEFSVKDNGMGIQGTQTEKIFKVLGRSVGDEYPGIGMGLAIVKKVLQRHRGNIWVKAVKDAGTIFYFTLAKQLRGPSE
tara:strand:+ start:325 stop:1065 length:741 start_codon:yes stop_codon:yes gene_type:complete